MVKELYTSRLATAATESNDRYTKKGDKHHKIYMLYVKMRINKSDDVMQSFPID